MTEQPSGRVVQLQRRPHPQQVSIERVFEAVRRHVPARLHVEAVVSSYESRGLLPRLRAVLEARRVRGDVTHVTGDVTYLTLLLPRRSTVLTVHDTEFLVRHGGWKRRVYALLWLRLPVWRAGVVTVVSEATRTDLLAVARCRPGKVRVVPNPVRDLFRPLPEPADGPAPPLVLLLGTWPTKNVLRSAAALRGLACRVAVVGALTAEQRAALHATGVPVEEHVDLSDEEVVALLGRCTLLLFPSLHEGFGVPVLEAQAVGRAVVTSDRSPLREVAGGAAVLVDPEDVASIRAGVQAVLGDPAERARLVAAGLDNARRYAEESVAAAYVAVYDELLSSR